MQIELIINEEQHRIEIDPDALLIDVIRQCGYTGTKRGCDTTNCGLCTVWIDGLPMLSCSFLAVRAQGKKITTIEGVQEEAAVFGSFLASEGGEQCGFCSPGFIMNVLALKRDHSDASEEEINRYLVGNLCRCTGYQSQLRAIRKYLEA